MSDFPLQRDAKVITRSRSLQRFRNSVLVGASNFLILLGFVVCSFSAYNMGYVSAKSAMAPTPRELARFQLLNKSEVMGIFSGAAITFVGIVTLSRVLKEQQSKASPS
jgi:hypothetical protein